MTNLTYSILPSFLWSLIMPIMYLVSGGNMAASIISQGVVTHTCVFFADQNLHQHVYTHAV